MSSLESQLQLIGNFTKTRASFTELWWVPHSAVALSKKSNKTAIYSFRCFQYFSKSCQRMVRESMNLITQWNILLYWMTCRNAITVDSGSMVYVHRKIHTIDELLT